MTRSELIREVAREAELSGPTAAAAVTAIFEVMANALEHRDEVRIPNFGIFRTYRTGATTVPSPRGGARLAVPPRRRIRFAPSRRLKEKILE